MLLLAIGVLIGVIVAIIVESTEQKHNRLGCMAFFVFPFCGVCFALGTSLLLGLVIPREYTPVKSQELITLQDQSNIEGHFFLISGNLGDIPSFSYYAQQEDGGYKFETMDASRVTIFEEDRNDAKLIKLKPQPRMNILSHLIIYFEDESIYEFYVPNGTILHTMELDAR